MLEETKDTTVDKLDTKKLDHQMSMAPFIGIGKIEYEEVYRDFEADLKKLEKDLVWFDFFDAASELEGFLIDGALLVIETKKYKAVYNNKPGFGSRKFRADDTHEYPAKFYTWQEIVDLIKLWKDGKFDADLKVDPSVHCINRNFRHVHVFKHKKGFLMANQFDMIYPDEIMKACIIMSK